MKNILKFNQREPLYCAQDLRACIGFTITDVISDENDCNARMILENESSGERVLIEVDKALDGETLFLLHR